MITLIFSTTLSPPPPSLPVLSVKEKLWKKGTGRIRDRHMAPVWQTLENGEGLSSRGVVWEDDGETERGEERKGKGSGVRPIFCFSPSKRSPLRFVAEEERSEG